jgi:hypothetical protein
MALPRSSTEHSNHRILDKAARTLGYLAHQSAIAVIAITLEIMGESAKKSGKSGRFLPRGDWHWRGPEARIPAPEPRFPVVIQYLGPHL